MSTNAAYYYPAQDWAAFSERAERGALGYHADPFADSVLPIHRAGLVRFVEPGMEIAGLLQALAAPGHSPGQLAYLLRDGETLLFSADVLHNPMQVLHPQVNSRWCEDAETARATRLHLLALAARENCIVMPSHALGLEGWSIRQRDGRFAVRVNVEQSELADFHEP
jgi:glyoxylase-like metal-dependent hydrolase (beta-lactamase superfamily II)